MKKINYLGLVGLGCGALLLAGCGKSHTLTCELESGDQKQTIEITFNSDETEAESVWMEMSMELGDDVTEDQISDSKDAIKSGCESAGYKKCKVSTSGKKITYSFEATPDEAGFNAKGTLEDTKKDAEADGYTCK